MKAIYYKDIKISDWLKRQTEKELFRSVDIYQCKVCCAKTNLWVKLKDSWHDYTVQIYCTGDLYREHHELQDIIKRSDVLNRYIKNYEKLLKKMQGQGKQKVRGALKDLNTEKILLEKRISSLRQEFENKCDDVERASLDARIIDYWPNEIHNVERESIYAAEEAKGE